MASAEESRESSGPCPKSQPPSPPPPGAPSPIGSDGATSRNPLWSTGTEDATSQRKVRSEEFRRAASDKRTENSSVSKGKSASESDSDPLKKLGDLLKSTLEKNPVLERVSTRLFPSARSELATAGTSSSHDLESHPLNRSGSHHQLDHSGQYDRTGSSVLRQDSRKDLSIVHSLLASYEAYLSSVATSPYPNSHGSTSPFLYSQTSNISSAHGSEIEDDMAQNDEITIDNPHDSGVKKIPDSLLKPNSDDDSKSKMEDGTEQDNIVKPTSPGVRNLWNFSKWSRKKRIGISLTSVCFALALIGAIVVCVALGVFDSHKNRSTQNANLCDSSLPLSQATTTMPSFWWSNSMQDNSRIQLFYAESKTWVTCLDQTGALVANVTEMPEVRHSFVAVKSWFYASGIYLKASNDKYVKTLENGTLAATASTVYAATVFLLENVGSQAVRLRTTGGAYIRPSVFDGSRLRLVRVPQVSDSETFHVRQGNLVPAIRGVNLGGWLVVEEWMTPTLFKTVPEFIDGIQIQFKSVVTGLYMYAENGGGGAVTCSSLESNSWETFYFRMSEFDTNVFQLLTYKRNFLAFNQTNGFLTASETAPQSSGSEDFRIYLSSNKTLALIQTSFGTFFSASDDGNLTALGQVDLTDLTNENSSIWNSSYAFEVNVISEVRGEYQLSRALDQSASSVIEKHRRTFIGEKDFSWLSKKGINAVRIPVGFWILNENLYPYASNAVVHLDRAFGYAEKYDIRVYISIHGAYGSQNGFEHSGSRDGIPYFGDSDSDNVNLTLSLVEFIASRYANRSHFLGIGLLNEPTSYGVPSNVLYEYYNSGYDTLRKYNPCAYVGIDPWIDANLDEFDNYFMTNSSYSNVIYDFHAYQVFDSATFMNMTAIENINYVYNQRRQRFETLEQGSRLLMVGEWSLALMANETVSQDYKYFGDAQLEVYSQTSAGWFFWAYKLARDDYPNWSFKNSLDLGWLRRNSTRLW